MIPVLEKLVGFLVYCFYLNGGISISFFFPSLGHHIELGFNHSPLKRTLYVDARVARYAGQVDRVVLCLLAGSIGKFYGQLKAVGFIFSDCCFAPFSVVNFPPVLSYVPY